MTKLGEPSTARPRPMRERARTADERMRFAAEVRAHLERTPRQLPSRYLYDELGSALFEAICRLPWYRITRAEERLLLAGRDDVLRLVRPLACVVELGPGSGAKLVQLLSAPAREARPLDVHLVDLSPAALEVAACAVGQLSGTRVLAHEAEYLAGIREAVGTRPPAGHALVVLLGSNIGNFDPGAARVFLGAIRTMLRTGDALLLGADLIKPARELALAYDDPLGVTAAFNRNLLVRINRELGADFDLPRWDHRALWNARESRVEMHLVARAAQRVRIPAAELEIALGEGEAIWTESSYKYTPADLDALLQAGGFRRTARWGDDADGFALTLAQAT